MLSTDNDSDWETKPYKKYEQEADILIKKDSWHDLLLSLVTDSDVVICAGLSAGSMVKLGYMKWNYQEGKGVKTLIGIKELLRGEQFPPEFNDMKDIIQVISIKELSSFLSLKL